MIENIYLIPTNPKKAFTCIERSDLISCAFNILSNVEAIFDQDDEGNQLCSFMPIDGGCSLVFVGIQKGALTLWDGPTKLIITTRDVREIVAAIIEKWGPVAAEPKVQLNETPRIKAGPNLRSVS